MIWLKSMTVDKHGLTWLTAMPSVNQKPGFKILVNHLDISDCWFQQSVGDIDSFLYLATQQTKDPYNQQWQEHAHTEHLCLKFCQQTYLQNVRPPAHLRPPARLITSSYQLRVVTGRTVRRTPTSIQIQKMWNMPQYRGRIPLPLYNEFRYKLIPRHCRVNPSLMKFSLLNTTNHELINTVVKFVHKAFTIRTDFFTQPWVWEINPQMIWITIRT